MQPPSPPWSTYPPPVLPDLIDHITDAISEPFRLSPRDAVAVVGILVGLLALCRYVTQGPDRDRLRKEGDKPIVAMAKAQQRAVDYKQLIDELENAMNKTTKSRAAKQAAVVLYPYIPLLLHLPRRPTMLFCSHDHCVFHACR